MGVNNSLEVFLDILIRKHPHLESSRGFFWKTFDNSGVVSIEINSLRFGVAVSLPKIIIVAPKVLNIELNHLLFTLFHEIAHQYQFKKYGVENMLKIQMGRMDRESSISFLRQIETVADEYAERKLREMKKLNFLPQTEIIPKGFYKTLKDQDYEKMIDVSKKLLEGEDIKDHKNVSKILQRKIIS